VAGDEGQNHPSAAVFLQGLLEFAVIDGSFRRCTRDPEILIFQTDGLKGREHPAALVLDSQRPLANHRLVERREPAHKEQNEQRVIPPLDITETTEAAFGQRVVRTAQERAGHHGSTANS
jgi:hypothetical protein